MLRICAAFVLACLPLMATANPQGIIRVIDADTWDVGTTRVRLHGIDAPELSQTCDTEQHINWACGLWASNLVRAQYDGKSATCDTITIDKYNRTVARCWVDGRDVGQSMVADGLAFAFREYSMAYDLDEKGAAINDRGLHAHRIQSPAQFRKSHIKGRKPPDHDCVIKGNISSKGIRIFHLPGQQYYDRTGISLTNGERWFCTSEQAIKAGWRQSYK
ncbi:MAG: thermonuclease family protein [Rhodobacteraceae bacterium]|nr:thermonuclease family protein [Paracoccaceae bacterium]